MLVLGGAAIFVTAFAGTASASTTPSHDRAGCAAAGTATYQHTFDGPAGTATITAVDPLCAGERQAFSLISYTTPAKTYAVPQFVYDTDQAVIDADHRSITLTVAVPGCYTQVDTVFGSDVLNEISSTSTAYGNAKLGSAAGIGHRSRGAGAWYNGGTSACAPKPSVQFGSHCDGGFTAALANRTDATVDAVFLIDDRGYRLAPGARKTVVGPAGGTLTVRDNTFRTSTGTWSKPAQCVQPTPSATTVPAPPATTSAPTSAPATVPPTTAPTYAAPTSAAPTSAAPTSAAPISAAPSSAGPSPSASSSDGAGVGNGTTDGPTTPTAIVTSPPASLPVTGSGAGSVALIAFGLLLVGGGLLILGRQVYQARHAA
jgi:LPXTG-motif cell wall-anchored protein